MLAVQWSRCKPPDAAAGRADVACGGWLSSVLCGCGCIDAGQAGAALAQNGIQSHAGLACALGTRQQQALAPGQRRQSVHSLPAQPAASYHSLRSSGRRDRTEADWQASESPALPPCSYRVTRQCSEAELTCTCAARCTALAQMLDTGIPAVLATTMLGTHRP